MGEADYTSSPISDQSYERESPAVSPIPVPQSQDIVTLVEQVAHQPLVPEPGPGDGDVSVGAVAGLNRSTPPDDLVFPRVRARCVERKLSLESAYLEVLIQGCVAQDLAPESVLNYFAAPGEDSFAFIQSLLEASNTSSSAETAQSFYSFLYPHVSNNFITFL